jgi:anaerobic dimethyl sulfoxide reductase subunit C
MLKEWPLVAFTILGQTAVGLFWFFHLPFLVRGRVPGYSWRLGGLVVLALVFLLTALAAVLSFFHLRHPLRARRALGNLGSSWLSREILFELLFLALVAVAGWLGGLHNPGRELQWGLLAAAGLAGGLFLFSMAKLYMLPAVPAWRGAFTPLSFLSTTLVAGALTTEVTARAVAGPGALSVPLMPIALALIAGEIVLAAVATPRAGIRGGRRAPSLRPDEPPPRWLRPFRIAALVSGLIFVGIDLASGAGDIMNGAGPGPALLLAFLFVLAGETAGRFRFYGLAPRPGGPDR